MSCSNGRRASLEKAKLEKYEKHKILSRYFARIVDDDDQQLRSNRRNIQSRCMDRNNFGGCYRRPHYLDHNPRIETLISAGKRKRFPCRKGPVNKMSVLQQKIEDPE
jgi:hypothetical protein